MKKLTFLIMLAMLLVASWAEAGYDLRQYPGPGRGAVIMGSDIDPNWFLEVWINPTMSGTQPQGPPTIIFIPRPTYQTRQIDWEVPYSEGVVLAYVLAWERDRAGNKVIKAMKWPVRRYINPVRDWDGYTWRMYIGLWELGVHYWWGFGGGYYGLPLPLSPRW